VNEVPDPVTFAFGVPDPHCAATEETSASVAATSEKRAILVLYIL
jgi:hypothetical protein